MNGEKPKGGEERRGGTHLIATIGKEQRNFQAASK
jgi:hypothetical protein